MKIIIFMLLILVLVLVSSCTPQQDVYYIKKDICRQPGNYCHEFVINGGTANISFPSVAGGDFNYTVES